MKKIYSYLFTALLTLFGILQANAALTTKFTWDIPGSVIIRVGANNAASTVTLPEGATSYVATLDQDWGTTYILPASSDYIITGGQCEETGTNINAINMSGSKGLSVSMTTYNEKTVHVNCAALQKDGEITLNVVNGREKISVSFDGTNRSVTPLHTGIQTVKYDTQYENVISIKYPNAGKDEEGNFINADTHYLKINGEEVEMQNFYGEYRYLGKTFNNNDVFEMKYWDVDDEPEETGSEATVTANYSGTASAALKMIFNATQMKSISDHNSFSVTKGDLVRFVFNTKDYTITANGTELTPAVGSETTNYEVTVEEDMTLNFVGAEREYGNTSVLVYAKNLDGLKFADIKGVELTDIEATGNTTTHTFTISKDVTKSATLNGYKLTVSLKDPKVFVDETEGYWIEASDNGGENNSNMGTDEAPLYVLHHAIVADTKLVVYVKADGMKAKVSDVSIRDSKFNEYTLTEGYNEFMVDPAYSSPFSFACNAVPDAEATSDIAFSAYANGIAVSPNENEQLVTSISGPSVFHVFAGRTAPDMYSVTAKIGDEAKSSEILVDRVRPLTNGNIINTFKGCEVDITPAEGYSVFVNGEKQNMGVTDGEPNTSMVLKVKDEDLTIAIGYGAPVTVSPTGTVEKFEALTLTFDSEAALNESTDEELMLFDSTQSTYAAISFNITPVSATEYKVVPQPLPTRPGDYVFVVPEGFFVVDGCPNKETRSEFTIALSATDFDVTFMPENVIDVTEPFAGVLVGEEFGDFNLRVENAEGIVLTLNGEVLTEGEEGDYTIDVSQNYIHFDLTNAFAGLETLPAPLTLSIAEGTLTASGTAAVAAITHEWTVQEHKEYGMILFADEDGTDIEEIGDATQLAEIYFHFPDCQSVEIFYSYGVTLMKSDYSYNATATLTVMESSALTRGESYPVVKATFSPAPTATGQYKLSVSDSTFTYDGTTNTNAAMDKTFNIVTTGINGVIGDANGKVTVLTIDGRVVLRNADADAIRDLDKGLYIINGVKVVK